jgi:hypothetical protein
MVGKTVIDPIDMWARAISDEELSRTIPVQAVNLTCSAWEKWQAEHIELDYTRSVRYFISTQLLDVRREDTIIDIGGGDGSFYSLVSHEAGKYYVIDKGFINHKTIPPPCVFQGDATKVDLQSLQPTKIVLGHTFEHLQGSLDMELIDVISDCLPRYGKCCIEPIFIGKNYLEVFSYRDASKYDPRARKIRTFGSAFPGAVKSGMGFGRIYSPEAFKRRIVSRCQCRGLDISVFSFRLRGSYLPDMEKYSFRRRAINFPLRALLLEKL